MDTEAGTVTSEVELPASSEAAKTDATVVAGESTKPTGDTPAEQPPKKKGGGFQKRIDRLTRENYELRAKVETQTKAAPIDEEPKRDAFEDLESYHRAIARHEAKQALREEAKVQQEEQRKVSARQEQAQRSSTWESHVEKISEAFEDGEDVIENFLNEVTLHPFALDAIIASEHGGRLAYELGKDEKLAARIGKLSPALQAIEIGMLVAKIAAEPVKKASSAPAPINPIAGKGGGDTTLSGELSTAEWIKRRSKQVHGRKGT